MSAPPLPDSWDDEPWPLDEPDISYGKPVNWSDTHADPPQVADLADQAQELADRTGMSLERALVEVQRRGVGVTLGSSPLWWWAAPSKPMPTRPVDKYTIVYQNSGGVVDLTGAIKSLSIDAGTFTSADLHSANPAIGSRVSLDSIQKLADDMSDES